MECQPANNDDTMPLDRFAAAATDNGAVDDGSGGGDI